MTTHSVTDHSPTDHHNRRGHNMTGHNMTEHNVTEHRRRATAVVVTLVGLILLGAAALIGYSWRSELPDPVAVHWGANLEPNGFSSLPSALGPLLGFGAALVLAFGGATLLLGQSASTRRICAAVTIWSALFLSLLVLGTLYVQKGVSDAREAGGIGAELAIALLVPIVVAVVAGALVPGDPRQPVEQGVDAAAPRVPLGGGERAVWIGRVGSKTMTIIGLAAAAIVVVVTVLTRFWPILTVAFVVLALVLTMSSFVVRVDRTGLTVRSALGWPRTGVPLDEVVQASVTEVHPMRDYGGWGWRVGRQGRVGIAVRSGEALLVERSGGRSIAVTVDDATTAAGLLNTLADRSRT